MCRAFCSKLGFLGGIEGLGEPEHTSGCLQVMISSAFFDKSCQKVRDVNLIQQMAKRAVQDFSTLNRPRDDCFKETISRRFPNLKLLLSHSSSFQFQVWRFLKTGVPQNGGFIRWTWMILGYPYFWNPPYSNNMEWLGLAVVLDWILQVPGRRLGMRLGPLPRWAVDAASW